VFETAAFRNAIVGAPERERPSRCRAEPCDWHVTDSCSYCMALKLFSYQIFPVPTLKDMRSISMRQITISVKYVHRQRRFRYSWMPNVRNLQVYIRIGGSLYFSEGLKLKLKLIYRMRGPLYFSEVLKLKLKLIYDGQ
jgi:hypothetical protein